MSIKTQVKVSELHKTIDKLRRLGPVNKRGGIEINTKVFGVSKEEKDAAFDALCAMLTLYGIRDDHSRLLRESISYIFFHHLNEIHGKREIASDAFGDTLKWQ